MSGRIWAGRLITLLGAVGAAVLIGSAALATTTVPLKQAHRNTTAAGFSNQSCDQIPGGSPIAGKDGFVFVLPDEKVDFVSLTLIFQPPGAADTVTVTIRNPDDDFPDGITTNGTSKAFVLVPAGWLLVDGTAEVSGATKAESFNVTHICPGDGSALGSSALGSSSSKSRKSKSGESPSNGGSTSTDGSTSTGGAAGDGGGGAGGGLPLTGTAVGGIVLTGIVLVAAGIGILLSVRRRATVVRTAVEE